MPQDRTDEINCKPVAMLDVELKLEWKKKYIIIIYVDHMIICFTCEKYNILLDLSYLWADIFLNASTSDNGDANINISLTSKSKKTLESLKRKTFTLIHLY